MSDASAPIETPVRIIYQSKPFYRRPSFVPTLITVLGVGSITFLLIGTALHKYHTFGAVAILVALSAAVIGFFWLSFVLRWISDLSKSYTFSMTERAIIFTMSDRLRRKITQTRIPYARIEYVENLADTPFETLCIHLKEQNRKTVDVPIWSMTNNPKQILEILLEKHVRIVRVDTAAV